MKIENVISVFDGMSGGQIALKELAIDYKNYFASEIEPSSIKVTKHNFPNTIHVGDVRNITYKDGILKTDNGEYNIGKVGLLIGGSPCQNFSFIGNKKGMTTKEGIEITTLEQYLKLKEEGFEFQGQSYLFWEYIRLKKEINPTNFFLENIKMSKKWKDIFSNIVGLEPIFINSSLVSFASRPRYYWTNIVSQDFNIEDKGVLLRDNFDREYDESLVLKGKGLNKLNRDRNRVISVYSDKCPTLMKSQDKLPTDAIVFEQDGVYRYPTRRECELMQGLPENYTKAVNYRIATGLLGNAWNKDTVKYILKNFGKKE